MPTLLLRSIDPETNRFRFYRIGIEPNLFGQHSMEIHWGRIGTRGRFRVPAFGDPDEIRSAARAIAARKIRRGHAAVEDTLDEEPSPPLFGSGSTG